MKTYKNLNGTSKLTLYDYEIDFIRISFSDGWTYVFTESSVGSENLTTMKQLADDGSGLTSFIVNNVHDKYAGKMKGFIS